MARQIVVLALIFFAIVGMASATAEVPAASADGPVTPDAVDPNVIGTTDGSNDAAPIGSPVSESAFPNLAPVPSAKSGAATLDVSSIAAAATAAVFAGFFYF